MFELSFEQHINKSPLDIIWYTYFLGAYIFTLSVSPLLFTMKEYLTKYSTVFRIDGDNFELESIVTIKMLIWSLMVLSLTTYLHNYIYLLPQIGGYLFLVYRRVKNIDTITFNKKVYALNIFWFLLVLVELFYNLNIN